MTDQAERPKIEVGGVRFVGGEGCSLAAWVANRPESDVITESTNWLNFVGSLKHVAIEVNGAKSPNNPTMRFDSEANANDLASTMLARLGLAEDVEVEGLTAALAACINCPNAVRYDNDTYIGGVKRET